MWSNGSNWRSIPKLINLIFLLVFVSLVSPVNGIFLSVPGLCRTENLPKLFSFIVNPFVPKLLSKVCSMHEITVLTMCSASFLLGKFKAC
jgi:nucleoside permease NupC